MVRGPRAWPTTSSKKRSLPEIVIRQAAGRPSRARRPGRNRPRRRRGALGVRRAAGISPSFPRRREPIHRMTPRAAWAPAFARATDHARRVEAWRYHSPRSMRAISWRVLPPRSSTACRATPARRPSACGVLRAGARFPSVRTSRSFDPPDWPVVGFTQQFSNIEKNIVIFLVFYFIENNVLFRKMRLSQRTATRSAPCSDPFCSCPMLKPETLP